MRFRRRVSGLSLRDRFSSSDCGELGLELLPLCVKRSQLSWFGHLVRMPPLGGLPGMTNWVGPGARPRSYCRDHICHLAWERFRIPQEELESVAAEKEVWNTDLSLLPLEPDLG